MKVKALRLQEKTNQFTTPAFLYPLFRKNFSFDDDDDIIIMMDDDSLTYIRCC